MTKRYRRLENVFGITIIMLFGGVGVSSYLPVAGGWLSRVAYTATGVVFFVCAARAARMSVLLMDDKLVVHGVLRTVTLRRSEIDRLEVRPGQFFPFPATYLLLRSGRRIRVTALEPPNQVSRPRHKEAYRMVDELNRELSQYE
jgi:hypothetical protein